MVDVRTIVRDQGLDEAIFDRACASAREHGRIDGEAEWALVDDLVSLIWFGDLAPDDLDKIKLQCALFDVAPAYSTGMYLGVPFPKLDQAAKDYFWEWALPYVGGGVNPTSGSLVYVVAVDFDEREVPEAFLQLVETREWLGWGVSGKEWANYARQEKARLQ